MKERIMNRYEIVINNDYGSFALDGYAALVQGALHDVVSDYDGLGNTIGFIDFDSDGQAIQILEEALEDDNRVIQYADRGRVGATDRNSDNS